MKRKYKIIDCTSEPGHAIAYGAEILHITDGATLIRDADQRIVAVIPKTMAVIEVVEPE